VAVKELLHKGKRIGAVKKKMFPFYKQIFKSFLLPDISLQKHSLRKLSISISA